MPIDSSIYWQLNSKQNDAVQMVRDDFYDSRDQKADFMRKTIEWVRLYNQYVPPPKTKDDIRRARLSNPQAFSVVEHATAKMKSTLYPPNTSAPIARALPQEEGDVENAKVVELLNNYQMRMANIRYKGEIWLRNFNLFGVAPAIVFWRKNLKFNAKVRLPVDIPNPITGNMMRLGLTEPIKLDTPLVEFNGPDFRPIDVEDYFPDPAAKSFQANEMRYCVVIVYMPYEMLRQECESNPDIWNQRVFNLLQKDDLPPGRFDDQWSREVTQHHWTPSNLDSFRGSKGIVELKMWFSKDRFIFVANDNLPLVDMPNPYWDMEIPVLCPTRLPRSNYPWGKGHVEPLEYPIKYMNALTNSRLDTINLSLNPPWLLMKGLVDKTQFERLYPNKTIEVTSMDIIKKVDIPDVTANAYVEQERIRQDIEAISSLVGIATGQNPPNVRTGTQALSLLEIASERIQMDIDSFIAQGQVPLHHKFHMLSQMFMTEPQKIRILGEEDALQWKWVGPEEIAGQYDFIIESGARTIPKMVEAQQRLQGITGLLPVLTAYPDLFLKLVRSAYKDMGWLEVSKVLGAIIKELEAQRQKAPYGRLEPTGAGNQAAQGALGQQGAGTQPENQGDMENIVNTLSNNFLRTPELS